MSTSRSHSPLASQRSRWSGPQHHCQASCRSTMSTTSSRWMPRHEHNAPVPSPSSLGWTHPGLTSTTSVPSRPHSPSPVPARSRSPSPRCSPSPTSTGPSSPRSSGYVTTDKEDRLCGYKTPFTKGHNLRIISRCGQLRCPICPGRADRGWTRDVAKNHVLGLGSPSSRTDPKKRRRHRALARNEGWLPPLSAVAAEEDDDASI